jgi:hypothetical protein
MPYTDSVAVTAELPIAGVWLHDPEDPEATAHGFFYGRAQRSDTYDGMGLSSYYVGRAAPVVEFGEFEARSVDATLDVAYGPEYADDLSRLRDFAARKVTLWYRDNRGRALFGWISSFKTSDQVWGASVAITFTEAHHDITEVAA